MPLGMLIERMSDVPLGHSSPCNAMHVYKLNEVAPALAELLNGLDLGAKLRSLKPTSQLR